MFYISRGHNQVRKKDNKKKLIANLLRSKNFHSVTKTEPASQFVDNTHGSVILSTAQYLGIDKWMDHE